MVSTLLEIVSNRPTEMTADAPARFIIALAFFGFVILFS